MEYTSQKAQFGSYRNGTDGVSFEGITEYYYATLATDLTDGKPRKPEFNSSTWETDVQQTDFGTKNGDGVDYKYLWNVEAVKSSNSNTPKYSEVVLLQIYNGGRVPKGYISYYAGSATASAPAGGPTLDINNNNIQEPSSTVWKKADEYTGSDDDDVYLFEMTFVEYTETDEEGKNRVALIDGPTLIGRNGKSPVVLSLDNDSDVIAITADGKIVGQVDNQPIVTVNAKLTKNGQIETTLLSSIEIDVPDGFKLNNDGNSTETDGLYAFANGVLNIYRLPQGFSSGNFVFSYSNLSATFSLRTVQSNADYDLVIDKTLINNTSSGGPILIKVRKTKEDGTVEEILFSSEVEVLYTIGTGNSQEATSTASGWSVSYLRYNSETPNTYAPIKIELKSADGSFLWDWETIEFVQNGITPQDFNVTASAYAFVKGEDGKYESDITLTAHATNVGKDSAIKWYVEGASTSNGSEKTYTEVGSGKTYIASDPGTYKAQLGNDWYDFVTLSEVADGASGADAVVITAINSSMTFNKKETTTTETCEVVAWEGAEELKNISISKDGGSLLASNLNINGNKITIINPGETGSQTFYVEVTLTDKKTSVSKEITVNWTVVEDGAPGESVYAIVEPNTLRKGKIPNNISVEIYKKVGDGAPTVQSDSFYYTYQIDGGQISGYTGTSGNISLQNINGSLNSAKKIQFAFYSDVNGTKKLIDKATLEVLADGASISGVTEYFLISDKATEVQRPSSDPTEPATSPTNDIWYTTALAPTDRYPYLWSYEKITKDDGTSIYTEAVAIGRYGKNGTNAYSLSLDNDYDSVVYTNGGDCISGFPIKVEARKYYGESNQNYGAIFLKYSENNNESFSTLTSSVQYDSSDPDSFFSFNQMADSKGAILEIKRLPSGFQEMNFVFEWHSSNATNSSTYDKNTFKLKKVTALADYDLVFPQTVYNTTDTSNVSFTVLKKSASGTTTLNSASTNEVVAYYKKINNNVATYKKIGNWSELNKDDLKTSSVVLTSADGVGAAANQYGTFSTNPSIIWDEETIEFVSNGSNGDSLQVRYTVAEDTPEYSESTSMDWGPDFPSEIGENKKVWMVQKLSKSTVWSSPVQVSSLDGTPGKDGSDIEFVYYRNKGPVTDGLDAPDPTAIKEIPKNITDNDGGAWYKGPLGITDKWTYEYMSVRTKPAGATKWGPFSTPVIWSKWGDKGQDGDGVKYIYYLSNSSTAPGAPEYDSSSESLPEGWSDEPQGVEEDNQYEYVSKITVTTNADGSKKETAGEPALWAKYANDAQAIRIVSDKHQFHFYENDMPYSGQVATLTLQGSNIDTEDAVWSVGNKIVGTGSTIQITPEDFEFKLPNINTTGRLRFFYYHNGQAFSGDTSNNIYYTKDGSWEKENLNSTEVFLGAAHYNDNYYIIGYYGHLYSYKYEDSLSEPQLVNHNSENRFEAIASNDSFVVIVGYTDTNDKPIYWYSMEPEKGWKGWTAIEINTSDKFVAAEVINGDIYALTQKGSIYKIYSNNGAIRHERIMETDSGTDCRCFCNTNDGYLIGNDSGEVYKISNSSEEKIFGNGVINRVRAIKYFNDYYYVAGYNSITPTTSGKIYKSEDLKSWVEVSIEDSRAVWWLTIIRDRVLYCSGESGLLKKVSGEEFPFDSTSISATVDGLTDKTSIIKMNDAPSNYVLSLSNDSATVAASKDGTVTESALEFATKTTAILQYGSIEETNVTYKWQVANGTLKNTEGATSWFTTMRDDSDTATAIVSAYLKINGTEQVTPVATKVFTVTKNKQGETGENAVSYKLLATPNRIQAGTDTEITFSVLKHDGSKTDDPIGQDSFATNYIVIKVVSGNSEEEIKTFPDTIKATTTYKLYVNGAYQDTEVVDAAPIIYTHDLKIDIDQMRSDNLQDVQVFMITSGGGQSTQTKVANNRFLTISVDGGNYVQPTMTFEGKIAVSNFDNAEKSVSIKYTNASVIDGNLFATITITEEPKVSYTLFHNKFTVNNSKLKPDAPAKNASWESFPVDPASDSYQGWYKNQVEEDPSNNKVGSVYRVTKSTKISQWDQTEWQPVERINGVLTTKTEMLALIGTDSSKGVYHDPDDDILLVNADAIKTGALLVGELTDGAPGDNTKFYANIEEHTVYASGWNFHEFYISYKNYGLGAANSFIMYPGGCSANNKFGASGSKEWALGIGQNFGVTKDGALYASAGKIGTMEIGDINELPNQIGGNNLLREKDNKISIYGGEADTSMRTSFDKDLKKLTLIGEGKSSTYYYFMNSTASASKLYNFKAGETYQFEATLSQTNMSAQQYVCLYIFETNDSSTWTSSYNILAYGNFASKKVSTTFKLKETTIGVYVGIKVVKRNNSNSGYTDTAFSGTISLSNPKIAVEIKLPSYKNGSYSWEFSESKGISMYQGYMEGTGTKVFSVDGDGMFVKGTIEADAGNFGGMMIVDGTLQYSKDTQSTTEKIILSGEGLKLDQYTSGATNTKLTHGAVQITTSNKNYILLNTNGLMAQNYSDKSQTCCLDANGIQWADNGTKVGTYSTQRAKIYYDSTKETLAFQDSTNKTPVYLSDLLSGSLFKGPYYIVSAGRVGILYITGKIVFGRFYGPEEGYDSRFSKYICTITDSKGASVNVPPPAQKFEMTVYDHDLYYNGDLPAGINVNYRKVFFENNNGSLQIRGAYSYEEYAPEYISISNYYSLPCVRVNYFIYSTDNSISFDF